LKRYRVNGINYVYHRSTGIRLPGDIPEDHPAFIAAYAEALERADGKRSQRVSSGSVEDVVRRYLASAEFKKLSRSYQEVRRRDLRRLCDQADGRVAALRFADIKARHIKRDMASLKANPANERLKSWRALAQYAEYHEFIATDPTRGVVKVAVPEGEGHAPWTFKGIEQFRAYHRYGSAQRVAFELNYWCGTRISDCVGLGEDNINEEDWLEFVQQKTQSAVIIPFRRALPPFAVEEDLVQVHRAIEALGGPRQTFLETALGRPRSAAGASQWFSEAARAAGLPAGRTSHDLRKSRMILLAERGATLHQIAAWSGHETLKEIERYTKRANHKRILSASVLETGAFL
jgi:integrase